MRTRTSLKALKNFIPWGYTRTDCLSLALHTFLADKLESHPDLLPMLAERNEWCIKNPALRGSYLYFQQWADILSKGIDAVTAVFRERTEYGQVMRSCSPAVAIITSEERSVVLEFVKRQYFASQKVS